MTKYTIKNTKNNEIRTIQENDVVLMFSCDTFEDKNILFSDLKKQINDCESLEEIQETLDYWKNKNVFENEKEYYTSMIEYVTYTSNTGIKSEFQVLSIE